jgi:hypothetical protein
MSTEKKYHCDSCYDTGYTSGYSINGLCHDCPIPEPKHSWNGWAALDVDGDLLMACPVETEQHMQKCAEVLVGHPWEDMQLAGYYCIQVQIDSVERK